jgi:methylphosphotriester-DNA--protein-cysteine methyltransferase
MRIRYLLVASIVAGALSAPLHAQDTTTKKPGGLKKAAHAVSATTKKAGRDAKAEVHRDASTAHRALKKAGNDTKTATGNATGIHKVGGAVGDAAQAVSHAGKKTGAAAKQGVKKTSSAAHGELTKAGKKAKAAVKDSTKKP